MIELQNIIVEYPTAKRTVLRVLDDISLTIQQGEFVSLVGPTGCGKSTLLRMVFGSQQPTQGQNLFMGQPITGISRDRGIVFQKYGLFPNYTVAENIAFGPIQENLTFWRRLQRLFLPRYKRLTRHFFDKAHYLVEQVGLRLEDAGKYPHELSGGMRQRVAIAQSLIMQPRVLMMDEPFGALDENTRNEMQQLVLDEWKLYRPTIIFITHDVEEAMFLGTRLIGLSQHWVDAAGNRGKGAKVVADINLTQRLNCPPENKTIEIKEQSVFRSLLTEVRQKVLTPEPLLKTSDFMLD
jgi:NitT/TauT family transport system ATP-binding protein